MQKAFKSKIEILVKNEIHFKNKSHLLIDGR